MGLDGISLNQLRVTPENNSSELNKNVRMNANQEFKIVDGLSTGQKIDPDRQNEHEKQQLKKKYNQDEDEIDEDLEESEVVEETIKYDLSRSDKYCLELDEKNNVILIKEKSTNYIIQRLDPQELSRFVNFLSNSQGSLINRKF